MFLKCHVLAWQTDKPKIVSLWLWLFPALCVTVCCKWKEMEKKVWKGMTNHSLFYLLIFLHNSPKVWIVKHVCSLCSWIPWCRISWSFATGLAGGCCQPCKLMSCWMVRVSPPCFPCCHEAPGFECALCSVLQCKTRTLMLPRGLQAITVTVHTYCIGRRQNQMTKS